MCGVKCNAQDGLSIITVVDRKGRPWRRGVFMFDNVRGDLRTYNGDWAAEGFLVMLVYRFGRWRYGVRPVLLRKLMSGIYKVLFRVVRCMTGIELPCEVEVGRNFAIHHFGGIVVSGYSKFGDNCTIRTGVVVGLRRIGEWYGPTIGNDVDIGAGAKLLGPIKIGNNVLIGANAVVIEDVPDNSIAVGVPAVIKPRGQRPGSTSEPTSTEVV